MDNFKEMEYDKAIELEGGSFIGFLSAILPLAFGTIGNIIGTVKVASSNNGELKTKDGNTYKWNNETKESNLVPVYYYF
ncbi:hypothetical protein N8G13_01835 [Mycoplasma zalophi]|uniref:hypothetical protein n=1 Tax=Mycoplasma zalophi TaxID=191287 RepID=UPI0021C94E88|nr:hypothetical protein [Mycoplasma zalophi]MCU4117196.1 hypothetical protein [Mycoplasma zalophi]